jgi:hypothetical protein
VRALPTGRALAAVGLGIPTILAIGTTTPTLHLAKSAEEILDRLAGSCPPSTTSQRSNLTGHEDASHQRPQLRPFELWTNGQTIRVNGGII